MIHKLAIVSAVHVLVCGCMQFSSIMLITLSVSLYSTHVTKCVFIVIIVHSPWLLCCLQLRHFLPLRSSRHMRMSLQRLFMPSRVCWSSSTKEWFQQMLKHLLRVQMRRMQSTFFLSTWRRTPLLALWGNTPKLPLQLMTTRECRNLGGKW